MSVKMFIDGVTIEVEQAHVQEYKNRGWKTFDEANALQNAKELAEKQQKRVLELINLDKKEQIELISTLSKDENYKFEGKNIAELERGVAEFRIKAILELEKGL